MAEPTADRPAVTLQRADLRSGRLAADILDQIIRSRDAAQNRKVSRELLARLKGLPVMLRVAGVPATLTFYAAKSGSGALGEAYGAVSLALQQTARAELSTQPAQLGAVALMQALATAPMGEQVAASAAVNALAVWLRRLSEAAEKDEQRAAGADDSDDRPARSDQAPTAEDDHA